MRAGVLDECIADLKGLKELASIYRDNGKARCRSVDGWQFGGSGSSSRYHDGGSVDSIEAAAAEGLPRLDLHTVEYRK
jgi:hypothetical protein